MSFQEGCAEILAGADGLLGADDLTDADFLDTALTGAAFLVIFPVVLLFDAGAVAMSSTEGISYRDLNYCKYRGVNSEVRVS